MRNAGLDEAQARIKIAGTDTTEPLSTHTHTVSLRFQSHTFFCLMKQMPPNTAGQPSSHAVSPGPQDDCWTRTQSLCPPVFLRLRQSRLSTLSLIGRKGGMHPLGEHSACFHAGDGKGRATPVSPAMAPTLSRVAWGPLSHRHKDSPYTSEAEEMHGNPQEPEAAAQLSGWWGCGLDMATARAELPSLVESL